MSFVRDTLSIGRIVGTVTLSFVLGASAAHAGRRGNRPTSAEDRAHASEYVAARGPTITDLGDGRDIGEVGLEGGLFLSPSLLVLADVRSTLFDHVGYCSPGTQSTALGLHARLFVSNTLFVSAGIARRELIADLSDDAPYPPSDTADHDNPDSCASYGEAKVMRYEAPLALGWQWQFSHFNIGFEALSGSFPLGTDRSSSRFRESNTTYRHHDAAKPRRDAAELAKRGTFGMLPTLLVGFSF
jgi:hypothetical protein